MKFSLVIPVYNESDVIVPTLTLLRDALERELPSAWEMIVVDNASVDDTSGKVIELHDKRISVITLIEKGKGRALRAGFSAARGDIVGFTDADLPITPEQILAALRDLERSVDEVLIGSRFHPESVMPGREWWRIGSSQLFNILARTIVGVSVSDTQCPLKLMKRKEVQLFLSTKEDTWFFDLEFIALLERLGIPFREVPVTWNEHRYPKRRSKLSTTRDGVRGVIAMLRIRRNIEAQLSHFK
jgi:glycosyltransferase involved in cell wall biosynthesis